MSTVPWKELKPVVEMMQALMVNAVAAVAAGAEGNESATDFTNKTYDLTADRVAQLLEFGVDINDEHQLYTFVLGFSHAVTVAHAVLHAYDFQSAEVEPEAVCFTFCNAVVANLMPFMQLLPLHLILDY